MFSFIRQTVGLLTCQDVVKTWA